MPQVVQELVSQSLPLMCSWNQSCNIQELYRYRSPSIYAGSVVGFASVGDVESCAGAFDLEVSDCSLGVDCGKASLCLAGCASRYEYRLTESFLMLMSFKVCRNAPGATDQLWRKHLSSCSTSYSCPMRASPPIRSMDHVPLCKVVVRVFCSKKTSQTFRDFI